MKPKLLATEFWGLGDLVIATPFLQAASEKFDVTLIAKPYALDLQARFWPDVKVRSFLAPWTAFRRKYHVWRWPWREMLRLRSLRKQRFDIGLSARWDPRDHVLVWAVGARKRLGYPRLNSQIFLNAPLRRPPPAAHRYEYWRTLAESLDFSIPSRFECFPPKTNRSGAVLVHSGAGQPVRVWPLVKYRNLVLKLRERNIPVVVACDPDQRAWWTGAGETKALTPRSVAELIGLYDASSAFIGNDSGPAHLAAACGVPTMTLFGPQIPEWFSPLGAGARWLEGKPCPYKPCSDYCRFPLPYCLANVSLDETWPPVWDFVRNAIGQSPEP
jgi:heptosyltransferase-2